MSRNYYEYRSPRMDAEPRREEFGRSESRLRDQETRGRGRSREALGRERGEGPSRRDYEKRKEVERMDSRGVDGVKLERDEGSEVLCLELGDGDASTK